MGELDGEEDEEEEEGEDEGKGIAEVRASSSECSYPVGKADYTLHTKLEQGTHPDTLSPLAGKQMTKVPRVSGMFEQKRETTVNTISMFA